MLLAAGAAGAAVLIGGGAALLLGGDDSGPASPTAAARPSAATSVVPTAAPSPPPVAPERSAAVTAATAAGRTPGDARAALGELLTSRADGTLALLRSTLEGDEAAAAVAARTVAASSSGLADVVGAWYDTGTATRVRAGLDAQSEASRAYAGAVAAGDGAAADRARAQMGAVSRELGAVLDTVTDGRIADYVPPQDAAQYRAYVDGLGVGDAAGAEAAAQWLRGRLAREGVALAAAVPGGGPS